MLTLLLNMTSNAGSVASHVAQSQPLHRLANAQKLSWVAYQLLVPFLQKLPLKRARFSSQERMPSLYHAQLLLHIEPTSN